jgi:uncharacterized sporulation protein YeaH/YhbH (DUF444 family)
MDLFRYLKEINQMMCYTEIGEPMDDRTNSLSFFAEFSENSLWNRVATIQDSNFKQVRLVTHDDIWKSFKRLFGGK